eukprot:TRINITY_DN34609_c0_g1_i1.p1 TRINITY_DN34609_c0_g1~~TRINITY_DN34609_c0_g1_i1.p1  ORF type:complete len:253 (-),score=49.19 TRINITY_DN34609_c0_g1_i1:81-839(-)
MAATACLPSGGYGLDDHSFLGEVEWLREQSQLDASAPEFQMPSTTSSSSSFNPEAPSFTPLNDIKMRPEAAEFIPMLGAWASLPAALAEGCSKKKQAVRQMPPASEEEWETRIAKREKEVGTIKALKSYKLYVEVFPPSERSPEDPETPDPRDRSISKRMWKWNVEKWRLLLKSRCVYSRSFCLQTREYLLTKEAEGEILFLGGLEDFKQGQRLKTARLDELASGEAGLSRVAQTATKPAGKFNDPRAGLAV